LQISLEKMQPLHYYGNMPVIQRFANCRVRINHKDHPPPHFHVITNDGREALVTINPIKIAQGHVTAREISEVLAWAGKHPAWLDRIFKELQQ